MPEGRHARKSHWGALRVLCQVLVAASLSVSVYYQFPPAITRPLVARFDYGPERFARYERVRREWRPRIGATLLARAMHTPDRKAMGERIALFHAAWFAVLCGLYAFMERRASIVLMLGSFAAVAYAGSPIAQNTWNPWDLPTLCFAAAALAFALRGAVLPLAATVIAGVTVKETLALMALLPLFFDGRSRRWRWTWAAGILGAACATRLGIEWSVQNPMGLGAFSFHVRDDPARPLRWIENLRYVFSATPNHVLWANAGTFLLLFVVPTRDRVLSGMKLVGALFYAGLLFAANFHELRVLFEVLPAALLSLFRFVVDDEISK